MVSPVFPYPQKPTFSNSSWIRNLSAAGLSFITDCHFISYLGITLRWRILNHKKRYSFDSEAIAFFDFVLQ